MKTEIQEIDVNGMKYIRKDSIKKEIPQGDDSNPFMELGKSYFIRTVTHYFTGTLIWVGDKELCLENVCWIADTGRFNEFVSEKNGANESEPFPQNQPVIIGRGSIIDMSERSIITTVK